MSLDQQKQLKRPSSPIRPRSYSLVSDQAHSRDIKCATCFDYAVIYEDSEVSQHFRRWYTSWQRGLHTSPTSFPTSTSVTATVSTKGDVVTDPEGPSSSEGVGGYQKVLADYALLFEYVTLCNERWKTPEKLPIATGGHPSYAVISIVHALEDLAAATASLFFQTTGTTTTSSSSRPSSRSGWTIQQGHFCTSQLYQLMQNLSHLLLYPKNRSILILHRAPEVVLKVFTLTEAWFRTATATDDQVASQLMLIEIAHVFARFIDPTDKWWRARNLAPYFSEEDETEDVENEEFEEDEGKNEIKIKVRKESDEEYDQSIIRITTEKVKRRDFLKEVIRLVERILLHLHRDSSPSMAPSEQAYQVHKAFLNMLGTFITAKQLDAALLQELAVVDVLTALLGWPPWVRKEGEELRVKPTECETWIVFRRELDAQLLAWRILVTLDALEPQMRWHYLRTVTCAHITELWLWTVWQIQRFASRTLTIEKKEESEEWTYPLKELLAMLRLVVSIWASPEFLDYYRNTKDPRLWEESISILFQCFQKPPSTRGQIGEAVSGGDVADCRGNVVRSWIREGRLGTFLQQVALMFLEELVEKKWWSCLLLSDAHLWNLLYSDVFFMNKPDSLQRSVLEFTIKAAILEDEDNQAPCSKLLTMLYVHRCGDQMKVVLKTLEALGRVLRYAPITTRESLKRLHCVSELTLLLRESALKRSKSQDEQMIFWQSLELFDEIFLENQELTLIAHSDPDTLAMLFGLIFDDTPKVSLFAIRHLANMMSLCGSYDLFISYLDAIPTQSVFLHGGQPSYSLQRRLIKGIIKAVGSNEYTRVRKKLWKAGIMDCLNQVLQHPLAYSASGLIVEKLEEVQKEQVNEANEERVTIVLRCLGVMMKGGGDILMQQELIKARKKWISLLCNHLSDVQVVLWELLNLIVDEQWSDETWLETVVSTEEPNGGGVMIKNSAALELFIGLYPVAPCQIWINTLLWCARQNDLNVYRLAKSSILYDTLLRMPPYQGGKEELLERMATVSISSIQVKSLLNKMTMKDPVYLVELLDKLAKQSLPLVIIPTSTFSISATSVSINTTSTVASAVNASSKNAPLDYFYLSGHESGFLLPEMSKLPLMGYSFFCWLCIDHFKGGPRLFSFLTTQGHGVEAYFYEDGYLRVCVTGGEAKSTRFRFNEKKWYFVAVIHRPAQRGWGFRSPEVMIVVDGKVCVKAELPYPVEETKFTLCSIGSTATGKEDQMMTNSIQAQMASIYLLEDAISSRQVNALYHLGRGHSSQLRAEDSAWVPKQCLFLFDGALCGKLLLQFSPRATRLTKGGELSAVNLSPRFLFEWGDALLINVTPCFTTNLQRAVLALGGIQALFLLLEQLLIKANSAGLSTFFTLVIRILKNSPENQYRALKHRSIRLLGFLIQQTSSSLTKEAFEVLLSHLGPAVSENEELLRRIYQYIGFDFRSWISQGLALQQYGLAQVRTCLEVKKSCRTEFGIRYFMDSLYMFHPYFPPEVLNFIVTEVLMKGFLKRRTTREEVNQVWRHLMGFAELKLWNLVRLFLEMLLECLRSQRDGPFMEHALLSNAPELSRYLLFIAATVAAPGTCNIEEVQEVKALVVDVMIYFLASVRTPDRLKRRLKYDGEVAFVFDIWLEPFLTRSLYQSLLQYALEFEYDAGEVNRHGLKPDLAMLPPLKNVRALLGLLRLLPSVAEFNLEDREHILKEAQWLIEQTADPELIRETLIILPTWQTWLFPIFDHVLGQEILISLLLVMMTVENTPNSSKVPGEEDVFEETVFLLWQNFSLDQVREFCSSLLSRLDSQIHEDPQNVPLLEAATKVVHWMEGFLFYWKDLEEVLLGDCAAAINVGSTKAEKWRHLERLTLDNLIWHSPCNPWDEAAKLSVSYCTLTDTLDHILQRGQLEPIRAKLGMGAPCRMLLRMLTSAASAAEEATRTAYTEQFLQFITRHLSVQGEEMEEDQDCCPFRALLQPLIVPTLARFQEIYLGLWGDLDSDVDPLAEEDALCRVYRHLLLNCATYLKSFFFKPPVRPAEWELLELDLGLFVQSSVWQAFYQRTLSPALKQREEEEFASLVPSLLSSTATLLLRLENKKQDLVNAKEKQLAIEIGSKQQLVEPLVQEQINRWKSLQVELKSEQRRVKRQWTLKQYESLVVAGTCPATFWKQDRAENDSRMRKRLMLNLEFDRHEDASLKRDRSSTNSSASTVVVPSLAPSSGNASWQQEGDGEVMVQAVDSDDETLAEISSYSGGGSGVSNSNVMANGGEDKLTFATDCHLIYLLSDIKGRLELSSNSVLTFKVDRAAAMEAASAGSGETDSFKLAMSLAAEADLLRDRKWSLSEFIEIHFRRYMLRNSALEFFFADRTTLFFNFKSSKDRLKLYGKILAQRPSQLLNAGIRAPSELLRRSNLTLKWQRHEISNFDYLMQLNSLAGRTFNDLSQYFVFPWILKDYTSERLDLHDPATFRDLSKPVGALDETRLAHFLERYRSFEDPTGKIKKFHYGTHYSSAATVAFYLLRLEPFTSIHLCLQGGKFDHADRQFNSLLACWQSCLGGTGDVKELIPEFFYLPEFLLNQNSFDLGRTQQGVELGDVTLPPWAGGSAEKFIRLHRLALESDYVSAHLPDWIDLIFGYKQTGEEAVKANNVFYYLTYEGAIQIDSIVDPVERKSVEAQIYHFGQTPTQLLKKPHPRRTGISIPPIIPNPSSLQEIVAKEAWINLVWSYKVPNWTSSSGGSIDPIIFLAVSDHLVVPPSSTSSSSSVPPPTPGTPGPHSQTSAGLYNVMANAISTMLNSSTRQVLLVDQQGRLWSFPVSTSGSSSAVLTGNSGGLKKSRIKCPFGLEAKLSSRSFACSTDTRMLIACGHWDRSFSLVQTETGKLLGRFGTCPAPVVGVTGIGGVEEGIHQDSLTCCAVSEDGKIMVTGSYCATIQSWDISTDQAGTVSVSHKSCFYGHAGVIKFVGVNVEYDLVLSGAHDGLALVHALRSGELIRDLKFTHPGSRELGKITIDGNLVICSRGEQDDYLSCFSINGRLLGSAKLPKRVNDILVTPDGEYVILAQSSGSLAVHQVSSSDRLYEWSVPTFSAPDILTLDDISSSSDGNDEIIGGRGGAKKKEDEDDGIMTMSLVLPHDLFIITKKHRLLLLRFTPPPPLLLFHHSSSISSF